MIGDMITTEIDLKEITEIVNNVKIEAQETIDSQDKIVNQEKNVNSNSIQTLTLGFIILMILNFTKWLLEKKKLHMSSKFIFS